MSDTNKVKKKEDTLSVSQICNELKITKYYKIFAQHKYKGKRFSLKEWKKILSEDGLEIK